MKKFLALLVVTIISSAAYAQKGHYFYATLGGGMHDFDFIPDEYFYDELKSTSYWAGTPGMGVSFNLGWQYCVTDYFGFSLGANLCNYCESWHVESDLNNNPYFDDYTEPLRQTDLEIPAGIILQPTLGRRLRLLIGFNGYYSIMISQKWKMKKGSILYDNNTYSNLSGDTHFDKSEVGLGGDLQFCIAVDRYRTKEIIIGSYARYGLTDIQNQGKSDDFFDHQTLEYNGIANINVLGGSFSTHHRCVGLLLGFRYHLDLDAKKHKKKTQNPSTNNPKL